METKLAGYWSELLGVADVKASDHFIELGGHSMLAIKLINRLDDDFGFRLRMEDVFNPLHRLAAICDAMLAEEDRLGDDPLDAVAGVRPQGSGGDSRG
jgi:acyl carrier protein